MRTLFFLPLHEQLGSAFAPAYVSHLASVTFDKAEPIYFGQLEVILVFAPLLHPRGLGPHLPPSLPRCDQEQMMRLTDLDGGL